MCKGISSRLADVKSKKIASNFKSIFQASDVNMLQSGNCFWWRTGTMCGGSL